MTTCRRDRRRRCHASWQTFCVEIPDQPRYLYERGAFSHVPVLLGENRDEGWTFVNRSFPAGLTAIQYETAIVTEFGADASLVLAKYPAAVVCKPKGARAPQAGGGE